MFEFLVTAGVWIEQDLTNVRILHHYWAHRLPVRLMLRYHFAYTQWGPYLHRQHIFRSRRFREARRSQPSLNPAISGARPVSRGDRGMSRAGTESAARRDTAAGCHRSGQPALLLLWCSSRRIPPPTTRAAFATSSEERRYGAPVMSPLHCLPTGASRPTLACYAVRCCSQASASSPPEMQFQARQAFCLVRT